MKVLEIKGYRSLRALNAFNTLLLGLKMLPAYMHESYEDFYEKAKHATDEERETLIRQAAMFVELSEDEVAALASFCADDNGVPYEPSNLKKLGPDQLLEIVVAVCLEISRINIDMVSNSEKKKSETLV